MSEAIGGTAFIAKWETKQISNIVMVVEIAGVFYVFTRGSTQAGGAEEQKVWIVTV